MNTSITTEELLDEDTIKKIKQFEKDNPDKVKQITEDSDVEQVDNIPDWKLKTVTCRECGKVFSGDYNRSHEWVSPYKKLAGHIIRMESHHDKLWASKYMRDQTMKKNSRR